MLKLGSSVASPQGPVGKTGARSPVSRGTQRAAGINGTNGTNRFKIIKKTTAEAAVNSGQMAEQKVETGLIVNNDGHPQGRSKQILTLYVNLRLTELTVQMARTVPMEQNGTNGPTV